MARKYHPDQVRLSPVLVGPGKRGRSNEKKQKKKKEKKRRKKSVFDRVTER
jgi:hypothetical protein